MPILLKPNSNYKVVLSTDEDEPEDSQPRFICRAMSKADWLEIAMLNESLTTSSSISDSSRAVSKVIDAGLVGWENMTDPVTGDAIPFDLAVVDTILTPAEASELMMRIVSQAPSFEDKKKLGLQSDSDTAESVATAKG